ncbi:MULTISPECIES: serine/threonine-protein kinase [unclassified Modestobacter]
MAVRVGTVLAGRYEVTAPIATGGMGEVWQARDRTLGRTVAVKILKSEYTGDSSFLIRFRNEARHTAALSHSNIASVYDYGETTEDGQRLAYLVMEFVEGKPLVTILAERGRLTPQQTLDVLGQAGEGLSAAHAAGMVHRDIKPGNLLVRPDGMVKLTDFGIAYARDAAPLTRTGMVVGTAQYLSPEQAQGHVVTAASDVYSLGVLGYECIAGVRPFDGESQVAIALAHVSQAPPPLPAEVPAPLRALIERALSKDPEARFPDGGAFAAAARQVAAGGALPATQAGLTAVDDQSATTVFPMTGVRPAGGPRTAPRTMPPLHGPAVDDDGYGEGDDWAAAPPDRTDDRRRRVLWALAGLLLLALVAVGAVALWPEGAQERVADTPPTPSVSTSAPAAETTDAPAGISFDGNQYVGENVEDVQAALAERNLRSTVRDADDEQLQGAGEPLEAGDVAALTPSSGPLEPDQSVTLFVARAAYPPAEETPDPEPTETGQQTPTSTPPSASPTRTSASTTPPATSASPTSTTPSTPSSPPSTSSPPPVDETPSPAPAPGPGAGDAAPPPVVGVVRATP